MPRARYRLHWVRLGSGQALTTAEERTMPVMVLDNPLAGDILVVWLGHTVGLSGHRAKRRAVGI